MYYYFRNVKRTLLGKGLTNIDRGYCFNLFVFVFFFLLIRSFLASANITRFRKSPKSDAANTVSATSNDSVCVCVGGGGQGEFN